MYTIMDKSIVENKLKDLDYKNLKEQLLPNLSEIGIILLGLKIYKKIVILKMRILINLL
jgi:hypothetical protein